METKITCCDLMIGDWVKVNGEFIQVENIHKDMINYTPDIPYVQEEDFIEEKDITPIPLTAEVLEKNGFELYNQDFTSCRVYKFGCFDYIECHNDHEDSRYNYFSIGCNREYEHLHTLHRYIHEVMKIRYVHELQHALRLCGVDKEIML